MARAIQLFATSLLDAPNSYTLDLYVICNDSYSMRSTRSFMKANALTQVLGILVRCDQKQVNTK